MVDNTMRAPLQIDMSRHSLRHSELAGRIGVARGPITPPLGIHARLWGSARHDIAIGVHRPLLATCVYFARHDGSEPLALLTLDLSWWRSGRDELELRQAMLDAAGLEARQLILHVSHTHSAPSTSQDLADRPGGHLIAAFRDQIRSTCVKLIADARAAAVPATLSWATGSCRLAFRRDFVSPVDGSVVVGLNPGAKADDTLLVGRVSDADGRILATLVNYACHPTSLGGGNKLISSDYVGAMRDTVEAATGGAPCAFLHGASGDLTPRRSFGADVAAADQNGREIGHAVLATLESMFPPGVSLAYERIEESGTKLAVWNEHYRAANPALAARREEISLRLAEMPTREELKQAIATATEEFMRERLRRKLSLRETAGDGEMGQFPFNIWQLGDAVLVALPAEAHSPFQIELRRRFPGIHVVVLNIANGYLSYLPPREDFERDTYQAKVAIYAPGVAEQVLEAVTASIQALMTTT